MSKELNRTRVRDSRIAAALALLAYLFSRSLWPVGTPSHLFHQAIGYVLVVVCVFGRLYCTAFIGGKKNKQLITGGPFSVCRNPLYLFSLIGIAGIGFLSNSVTLLVFGLGLHVFSYHFLIRREEGALAQIFGDTYRDYMARVPRLIPKPALYREPEEVAVQPKFLRKAMRDAIAWFLAFPAFMLIDYLHAIGWLPAWYLLP